MALLQIICLCLAAVTGCLSDIAPAGGWVHWRPQAAAPHATVINTFRASLPAYYLLPPPPPPVVPVAPAPPVFTRFTPAVPVAPVAPAPPVAPVAPAAPAIPVNPFRPIVPPAFFG